MRNPGLIYKSAVVLAYWPEALEITVLNISRRGWLLQLNYVGMK